MFLLAKNTLAMAAPQMASQRQWGVTPAISTNPLTQANLDSGSALIEELKKQKSYEATEVTNHRKRTLSKLMGVVVEFIKQAGLKKGYSRAAVDQFGGKIMPYGSYRLGVFGPGKHLPVLLLYTNCLGSDIDTLIVAPKQITRVDFFEVFPDTLRQMIPAEEIGSFTAVPESFVPIIKLVLFGLDIDLIFARIPSLNHVPLNFTLNDRKYLNGMDDGEIKSVNGPRVTDEMLSLIPEPRSFRVALRAIKIWAKRRGIYANIMGFPGGVAWAILVARVCQYYPLANGSLIVEKFFLIMCRWNWPQPVLLKDIEKGPQRVWNPSIYFGDRKNLMPIITPAYPSMCSTYNVTKSNMAIIQKEFERGLALMDKISTNKLPWSAFFERHTFFTQDYKFYMAVQAWSTNADAALAWSGLVESKVRVLAGKIEDDPKMVTLAVPFTKGFERVHRVKDAAEIEAVASGSLKYQIEKTTTTDETNDPTRAAAAETGTVVGDTVKAEAETKCDEIHSTTFYVGLELAPTAPKQLDFLNPIKAMEDVCQKWASYDADLHKLDVFVISRYVLPSLVVLSSLNRFNLPDDVFDKENGDVKPNKPKKRKVQNVDVSVGLLAVLC